MQIVASLVLGVVLLGMTAWGALAIYYSNLSFAALRTGLSLTFAGSAVLGLLVLRPPPARGVGVSRRLRRGGAVVAVDSAVAGSRLAT